MRLIQPKIIALYLIPLILLIAEGWDGIVWLIPKWTDFEHGAYNHGFLLLGVSLWLLYQRIKFINDISNKGRNVGLFLLLGTSIGVFLAGAVNISSVQIVLFYLSLYSFILTFYGFTIFKKSILPLSLVIFALPIWGGLTSVLQSVTHEMAFLLVKLVGIPVFKEGFYLNVPAGSFEVEPSCSGTSYFLAAAPLAIVYAITNFSQRKTILVTAAAIIAASIVANWFRVLIIVVVGQMTNMQHSLVKDHFNLGWFLFGVFFVLLILLFNRTYRKELDGSDGDQVAERKDEQEIRCDRKITIRSVVVVSFVVSSLLFFQWQVSKSDRPIELTSSFITVPEGFLVSFDEQWSPTVSGAEVKRFQDPQTGVYFYGAFITHQTRGKEIVSTLNTIFDKKQWEVKQSKTMQIGDDTLNEHILVSKIGASSLKVWTWYRLDHKNTASQIKAKFYELLGYLKGDNSGAFLGIYVENKENAKELLQSTYGRIVKSQ